MSMVDNDLVCNYKKCRKRLVHVAWVTSCSHTFCDEDGTREFSKALVCPACDSNLNGKHDIVRHDLQPGEQYKSMILAGLKPEVIMEIASRAIAFWTYQAHQEKLYHEYAAEKNKESRDKLEHYYEQLIHKLQAEVKSIQVDLNSKSKELGETKRRLSEIMEQHQEKSRQHQKLQIMYDTLRRRSINPASNDDTLKIPANFVKSNHQIHVTSGATFLGGSLKNIPAVLHEAQKNLYATQTPAKHTEHSTNSKVNIDDGADGFVLKPFPTPSVHSDERETNERFGERFRLRLNTPKSN